jgi:hypothetical protein
MFQKALKRGMAVFKIHSHPTGHPQFSDADDQSDRHIWEFLSNLADKPLVYISSIMLPDQTLLARVFGSDGTVHVLRNIIIVGDNIQFLEKQETTGGEWICDEAALRTRQSFGEGTTNKLRNLTVGVVGCSGTGSWVAEMIARLGVGKLVLVDPDVIERKNLNRILNSTAEDAANNRHKTLVIKSAIERMGLNTIVDSFATDLDDARTIEQLAECDFLFGCMDSADGRDALNRIATYYIIGYLDLGVRLEADGDGGIQNIVTALHYLIPGGSTLLTRGVITAEQVADQAMRRSQPERYESLKAEGYVHGVRVDSPAVISINGFIAAHAVNEMLARIHSFRFDDNSEYRYQVFSLVEGAWYRLSDSEESSNYLSQKVGRGDCTPLIDNPSIR